VTIRAISLFCGAGGFCEGARLAGWQIVSAVEYDPQACRTHAANFPEVQLHERDIGSFLTGRGHSRALPDDPIDIVYGGPPARALARSVPATCRTRVTSSTRNLSAYAGR
jgi:DNA (cytosine-5)-methyltransferase 1